MKYVYFFPFVAALAISTGCQSNHRDENPIAAAHPHQQPACTVELIPNPQLTPTSREGDRSNVVYSDNIVAVYLNSNGATDGLTNAPPPSSPEPGTQR